MPATLPNTTKQIIPQVSKEDPFKIKKTASITTYEEAEIELSSITPDVWKMSSMYRRGKSIKDIYDYFNSKYKMSEISYALEKVVKINNILTNFDGDDLRAQMIAELKELESMAWNAAEISEDGGTMLSDKQIKTLLAIKDRIISLQGIRAPEKVEVSIDVEISDARERIKEKLERYSNINKKIIDVTPNDEV